MVNRTDCELRGDWLRVVDILIYFCCNHSNHKYLLPGFISKQSPLLKPIQHLTVRGKTNKIKSSANGSSGINDKILKHLDNKSILHLTRIYNTCLSTGYFPLPLKQGNTYLIPKPHKDHTQPQNYRPITL